MTCRIMPIAVLCRGNELSVCIVARHDRFDDVADADDALVEEADLVLTEPFVDTGEDIVHTVHILNGFYL
jgi:hypothetical protein